MTGVGCNSIEGALDSRELVLPPNLLHGEESRYVGHRIVRGGTFMFIIDNRTQCVGMDMYGTVQYMWYPQTKYYTINPFSTQGSLLPGWPRMLSPLDPSSPGRQ